MDSFLFVKEDEIMKINLDTDTRIYLDHKNCKTLTISASRDCKGDDCSEFYDHIVKCSQPDPKRAESFDRFDVDGLTVWFDKNLETVPVITLRLEHHILGDKIRVAGPGHPRK